MSQEIDKLIGSLSRASPFRRSFCWARILICAKCAARKLWMRASRKPRAAWAVARVSAREAGWDEILQRAQMLPMLSPRQVIIVDGAESVEKLGDKARDEILEALGKYLDSPAPFTTLLLEAGALDGRQRFFEAAA